MNIKRSGHDIHLNSLAEKNQKFGMLSQVSQIKDAQSFSTNYLMIIEMNIISTANNTTQTYLDTIYFYQLMCIFNCFFFVIFCHLFMMTSKILWYMSSHGIIEMYINFCFCCMCMRLEVQKKLFFCQKSTLFLYLLSLFLKQKKNRKYNLKYKFRVQSLNCLQSVTSTQVCFVKLPKKYIHIQLNKKLNFTIGNNSEQQLFSFFTFMDTKWMSLDGILTQIEVRKGIEE